MPAETPTHPTGPAATPDGPHVGDPGAEGDPPTAKGAQTRRAILDAAIERFGRDGFRATSVADVARDAGVGGTITYNYFTNKEALFRAALDEDAAAVIVEAATAAASSGGLSSRALSADLMRTLVDAVTTHPLARRVLSGLEPHVTAHMLDIPALAHLRAVLADRLAADQQTGIVRADIDPVTIANGTVAIMLSLLMAVLQFGDTESLAYAPDVIAVFQAATEAIPGAGRPHP